MSITESNHGAVIRGVEGDTIIATRLKALMWNLETATIGTHKMEITEEDTNGHRVYADAAPKVDGNVPIPCPSGLVDNFYIKRLDNGEILAYPEIPVSYVGSDPT